MTSDLDLALEMETFQKAALSLTAKSDLLLPQNAGQTAIETPLEHEQRRAYPLTIHHHTQVPPPRQWLL